jgi:DNA polymerase-3 subunit epsilon
MLRVHVAPVQEAVDLRLTGLVLVLEDLTREASAADERQRTLRRLTEETRGSLGSIRAAAETLLEFPVLGEAFTGNASNQSFSFSYSSCC